MFMFLLKVHLVVSLIIFMISYLIIMYKRASLRIEIRINLKDFSLMNHLIQSFIPIFNLVMLFACIYWKQSDWMK